MEKIQYLKSHRIWSDKEKTTFKPEDIVQSKDLKVVKFSHNSNERKYNKKRNSSKTNNG